LNIDGASKEKNSKEACCYSEVVKT
jgi:hypothetical protein